MSVWTKFKRAASGLIGSPKPPPPSSRATKNNFAAYKLANPQGTHAQFYAEYAMRKIRAGKAHSTLGLRLYDEHGAETDENHFLEAGRIAFERYRRLLGIQPRNRVVDYGCGSLRLGIHFIEMLDPGNYTGLDVTRDFIDIGASAVPELIAKKVPILEAIDAGSLTRAAEFDADFVISNAVSYHVHPDEIGPYLSNLAAVSAKSGSRLMFDAKCSASPVQFRNRGWAYPIELYVGGLKPLVFVGRHSFGAVKDPHANGSIESGLLEFRRD